MADLYVMCGIPGSGKSTVAQKVAARNEGTVIVSSDGMREKYFGDENKLYDKNVLKEQMAEYAKLFPLNEKAKKNIGHDFIFRKVDEACIDALRNGHDVIYDSTNLSCVSRARILHKFDGIRDKAYIVYVDCPLELALERNAKRARVVPEDVIRRMYSRLEPPKEKENFKKGFINYDKDWTAVITIKMS